MWFLPLNCCCQHVSERQEAKPALLKAEKPVMVFAPCFYSTLVLGQAVLLLSKSGVGEPFFGTIGGIAQAEKFLPHLKVVTICLNFVLAIQPVTVS